MTACTNNGGKARRVVTAALVGVLSVGAVPAIALATGADVSLMADDGQEVVQATVEYDGNDGADFSYTGTGQGLVPTSVEALGSNDGVEPELLPAKADREDGEYYYFYVELDTSGSNSYDYVSYVDKNGKEIKGVKGAVVGDTANDGASKPVGVGEYVVIVCRNDSGKLTYAEKAARFTISGQSLEGATIYQGDDVTDTTFNYTGEKDSFLAENFKKEIGIAVDGVAVDMRYFITAIYEPGAESRYTDTLVPGKTYVFVANAKSMPSGEANPYQGKRVEKTFVAEALDLSDVMIVGKATDDKQPTDTSTISELVDTFDGIAPAQLDWVIANPIKQAGDQTTLRFVSGPGESSTAYGDKKGEYTFELVANADATFLVPGSSKKFTVLYGDVEADVNYDDTALASSYDIDLSKDQSFDLSKIEVEASGKKVERENYSVTVKNAAGGVVEDLSAPGTYTVDVLVNWKNEDGQLIVAHKTAEVTVSYGKLTEATDVFMFFDGKNVEDKGFDGATFTGEDLSEKLTFVVKAGDKTLAEGTDYTVAFEKKQADGKWAEVDSIVDAGDYRVTVEGITYTVQDGGKDVTFELNVGAMQVTKAVVNAELVAGNISYLTYTGEVLTPTFTFYTQVDAKDVEVEVPADAYVATHVNEDGDEVELKDVDKYTATFEAAKDVVNYEFTKGCEAKFEVTDKKVFLDVPANEWYSQAVYTAAANGYMNGDGAGKTFSPMRELTRAEAACVLFNMAGGDALYGNLPGYNEYTGTYETGFSDVTGNEFYAKAVAWAEQTGVINGYADGTFGVSRKVTNEEFACMLANYAKAKGEFEAVDADAVLAEYPDASVVSDWAKDSVAWCVSEGIMGGGASILPAGSILRMRAATMAVNAQPEKADDALITIPSVNAPAETE